MIRNPSADDNTKPSSENLDSREQLFNEGAHGAVQAVQVSTDCITQLRGLLIDLDIRLLKPNPLMPEIPDDPAEFFDSVVRAWLDRHPTLQKAEVRLTGQGVHVLLWFCEPLVFETEGERDRWDAIIKVVQSVLPSDPDAPAITALTRPVGSVNSKNGAPVETLKAGEPVTPQEIETLFEEMCAAPFHTLLRILTGEEELSPCPVCRQDGTKLKALDQIGQCYGSCGKVKLPQLYDLFFLPRPTPSKEAVSHAQT